MNYDYHVLDGAPTRQCLICKCKEQPRALFVDFGTIWLCDDCKPKMNDQEIKQIEEMMRDLDAIYRTDFKGDYGSGIRDITERLYKAGYRKQVEGEWRKECLVDCEPYYLCSICEQLHDQPYDYCNGCGAKMKGGE